MACNVAFQMASVAIPYDLFADMLRRQGVTVTLNTVPRTLSVEVGVVTR